MLINIDTHTCVVRTMHAYIYTHTHILTYLLACLLAYLLTYIHTHAHIYIHTHTHTCSTILEGVKIWCAGGRNIGNTSGVKYNERESERRKKE